MKSLAIILFFLAIFLTSTFVQGAGVPYEDEEDSKRDDSSFVNQGSDKRNPPENLAVDSAISVVHEENSNRQPNFDDAVPPPACTCTYTGRNYKVIAYYGTDILENGQEVKKNEKVKFQCHDFGIYRLIGKKEITCEDCRPWHLAEYPNCVAPARVMPKRKQWKLETMLTTMEDNVKAHDSERKRIARSKPETRARQNALQRERRALKRQQAINPHDDNIKHTKCVQTPSLYSPSCSCPL
ncbi:hypothetical protein CDAR_229211 [Caerostris darwini]|uniref:Sushi domain-containing protein n=1 Tax=Caerostris darwini TaxID=1538125 RepID=A0AAV4RY87_9ARAC|nr:hypothetical protein CDAR_229211 [Caerostris darwini]